MIGMHLGMDNRQVLSCMNSLLFELFAHPIQVIGMSKPLVTLERTIG
jgi:hypothetical protein